MSDDNDGVALVWPVYNSPEHDVDQRIVDPHITALYIGTVADWPDLDDLYERCTAAGLDRLTPLVVLTGEFEVFGPEDGLVDVLLMDSPQLEAAREVAVMRLAEQGIYNASEWTDYRPHMTLGPKGSAAHYTVPRTVSLYPMELWYGDRKIKLV